MTERLAFLDEQKFARPDFVDTGPAATSSNPALLCLSSARRVLFLQGPVGPFFDRVARWLLAGGTEVRRVVFQGGDENDCKAVRPIRFNGPASVWPTFFAEQLRRWKPDCIVLFGQSRQYHKVAIERARAIDLPVVVTEEGYFRPGYVTMELGGVNGYSTTLDRYTWDSSDAQPGVPVRTPPFGLRPDISPSHFQKMAWHATQHYAAMKLQRDSYPDYQHHRCDDPFFYGRYWAKSWLRKGLHRSADRRLQRWLIDSRPPYFFVPLQLEGDYQITQHSSFSSNFAFILRVMRSFAEHAPKESHLVFRQHPHARGGPGHSNFIGEVAADLKIASRVHHMVEGDTPDIAEHSLGTIVINSTVGLQALERCVPLIVLGDSLYKRPHLTFSGDLDEFWLGRQRPDPVVTSLFLAQLKNLTQVPARVYASRTEPLSWSRN
jgi:capsular polysaccharide export protein